MEDWGRQGKFYPTKQKKGGWKKVLAMMKGGATK